MSVLSVEAQESNTQVEKMCIQGSINAEGLDPSDVLTVYAKNFDAANATFDTCFFYPINNETVISVTNPKDMSYHKRCTVEYIKDDKGGIVVKMIPEGLFCKVVDGPTKLENNKYFVGISVKVSKGN